MIWWHCIKIILLRVAPSRACNDKLDLHWKWWNSCEILVMCGQSSLRFLFFLLNKCYPQVSRIPLLPALSRITFSWILWRKEIHIYIFCFVTFFILNMCFFFSTSEMHHSRKLRSVGAPRSRRATCSIQSHCSQSLKRSLPAVSLDS